MYDESMMTSEGSHSTQRSYQFRLSRRGSFSREIACVRCISGKQRGRINKSVWWWYDTWLYDDIILYPGYEHLQRGTTGNAHHTKPKTTPYGILLTPLFLQSSIFCQLCFKLYDAEIISTGTPAGTADGVQFAFNLWIFGATERLASVPAFPVWPASTKILLELDLKLIEYTS